MSGNGDGDEMALQAWAAEQALLRGETRHDPSALDHLLADDFHEIGQSGRRWTRDETIAELVSAGGLGDRSFLLTDRRTDRVARGVILLSYLLTFEGRGSRRSSLWSVHDGELKLRFHQGTPVV